MNNNLPFGIAVDASACPNPGNVEYRGVMLPSRKEIFRTKIGYSSNNVGEYLAIVQALCWCQDRGLNTPIFSDSLTAIAWINNKRTKSKIKSCPDAEELLKECEDYVSKLDSLLNIVFWNKRERGEENPADFGRK